MLESKSGYAYDIEFIVFKDGFDLQIDTKGINDEYDAKQKIIHTVCQWIGNRNFGELDAIDWYAAKDTDPLNEKTLRSGKIHARFGIYGLCFKKAVELPSPLPEKIQYIENVPSEDREIISNLAKSIDVGDLNEKDGLEMSYEIALVLKSREVLL